jgi:hypothetical protein
MKHIYNLDTVIKINVNDRCKTNRFKFVEEEKKTFWNHGNKAGYITLWDNYVYSKEELENGKYDGIKFLFVDDEMFYRPYVEVLFPNDIKHIKKFNTYEEAQEYANEIRIKSIPNPLVIEN